MLEDDFSLLYLFTSSLISSVVAIIIIAFFYSPNENHSFFERIQHRGYLQSINLPKCEAKLGQVKKAATLPLAYVILQEAITTECQEAIAEDKKRNGMWHRNLYALKAQSEQAVGESITEQQQVLEHLQELNTSDFKL